MIALGFAAAATIVVGTNAWVRADVGGRAYGSLAEIPARALAIVPGAPTSRGKAKAILESRLASALELYRAGRVTAILISGIDTTADPETSAMQTWLADRDVPNKDVVVDSSGSRTRQTMVRAASIFGVREAIICTETLSAPRSLYLAQGTGIDAVALAMPTRLSNSPRFVGMEALKTTLAFFETVVGGTTPKRVAGPSIALR